MASLPVPRLDDSYGAQFNFLFNGDMSVEGYIQISVDNRGTPSLRGCRMAKINLWTNRKIEYSRPGNGSKKIIGKTIF